MNIIISQFNSQLKMLGYLCLLLIATFFSSPAMGQTNSKIQTCNSNFGKTWYFSLGSEVFFINNPNFSNGVPIVDNVSLKYAITPPNPSSPIGCRDNPQQLEDFAVLNWPTLESKSNIGAIPKTVGLFQLYRYPVSDGLSPEGDPEIVNLELAAIKCRNKKFIHRWNDGTILCTDKEGQLNTLLSLGSYQNVLGWEFIISGNLYRTPLGQNLVMSQDVNSVDVSYLLSSDILLRYNWSLPKSATQINADYLISVDRIIQTTFFAFQVKNYPWPKPDSSH